jgi:hypothetical protein
MNGGTVSGNTTDYGYGNDYGGGVYANGGSFTMSGDAAVDTGNPVYLDSFTDWDTGIITRSVITLSGALTANPAANIEYPTDAGTQVLGDDSNTPGG